MKQLRIRIYPAAALAEPPGDELIHKVPSDDLVAMLVVETPEFIKSASESNIEDWGVSRAQAWEIALDNIQEAAHLTENRNAAKERGFDVVALFGDTTFASALALRLDRIANRPFERGALLAIPEDNLIMFYDLDDKVVTEDRTMAAGSFIAEMAALMMRESQKGISQHVYMWSSDLPWQRLTSITDKGAVFSVRPPGRR